VTVGGRNLSTDGLTRIRIGIVPKNQQFTEINLSRKSDLYLFLIGYKNIAKRIQQMFITNK
jgi:hypothetical protein